MKSYWQPTYSRTFIASLCITFVITLGFILSGCDDEPDNHAVTTTETPVVKTQNFFAMGTMVQVTTYDVPQSVHDAATREVETAFLQLYRQWQPWQKIAEPDGELATINQDLLAGRVALSGEKTNRVMLEAAELSKASRGLFNPAIGELVKLWGFNRDSDLPKQPPSATDIRAILDKKPGMDKLRYTANSVKSTEPLALDFGAFLKGYAVDRAIDILRDYGIKSALVNAGGDLRVLGKKQQTPWVIGIRDPRRSEFLAQIQMRPGEAIFTSGDYERYFEQEVDDLTKPLNADTNTEAPKFAKRAQRYHHIIDPRTGYPASQTASVTIITDEGAKADAAATALFVAGPGNWEIVAVSMGIRYVLMVDVAGNVYLNPAMAERVKFNNEPQGKLLLSAPLVAIPK